MGGSESKESVIINENNGGTTKTQQNMDFSTTIKLDTFFLICIILIVFLVYKINKYFKNYVNKKAVVQV